MYLQPLKNDMDLLVLYRHNPSRYPVLLESAASGTGHINWDILMVANGDCLYLTAEGLTYNHLKQPLAGSFLDILDWHWKQQKPSDIASSSLPFTGGWALQFDYEFSAQLEPTVDYVLPEKTTIIAQALRCPAAIIRNTKSNELFLIIEDNFLEYKEIIYKDILESAYLHELPEWKKPCILNEESPEFFLNNVERILEYLSAGDVFQVNLSRRWNAVFSEDIDPAALYSRLRQYNPAPFAGLFFNNNKTIVSASPERLVSVHQNRIESRPIAGTRPRFAGDNDAEKIQELISNNKEQAEHIMLIDLERNDIAKVSTAGSVEVNELMVVETYSHVHHIVSNVVGERAPEATPGAIIAALFPGGTITGCPKVRCMEIISELEQSPRGAYTGAMGWLNHNGDLDLNILIRSAEVINNTAYFSTGAGIVLDSIPQNELEETRAKARGMLAGLGLI